MALVSDAGMPLVSDPGYRLVRAAIENGIRVEAVPGASALLTALAASGLPTDSFHFGGFLPAKSGQRLKALEALKDEPATLIFYEAPHRIVDTLAAVEQALGDRPVVVARELTKIHEEFLRGTAAEVRATLAARESVKGEITLLIGKGTAVAVDDTPLADAVDACVGPGHEPHGRHQDRGASPRPVQARGLQRNRKSLRVRRILTEPRPLLSEPRPLLTEPRP